MMTREIHLERLLGRKVRDPDGRSAGSIEEVVAEERDGEWIVVEYLTGPEGMLARLSSRQLGLWVVDLLGGGKSPGGYRIPWDQLDLSAPARPRVRCRTRELQRAG